MSEEKTPTKVLVKLTRPALERLLGGDIELETIIGQQAVQNLIQHHGDRILKVIKAQISAGLDLQGYHIANVALHDCVRDVVKNEVGNYVRCHDMEIRGMINEEIKDQLPGIIKNAVDTALRKAADRVTQG